MTLIDIILTTIIISLFCLGLRTVFSDGMIFHFLREPFEYDTHSKVMNVFRRKLQRIALSGTDDLTKQRKRYLRLSEKLNIYLKPFLLCVICFSSVWGGSVFIALHGLHFIPELIISCISSAFIIKLISDHVEF
jgi:hypothetical protein